MIKTGNGRAPGMADKVPFLDLGDGYKIIHFIKTYKSLLLCFVCF